MWDTIVISLLYCFDINKYVMNNFLIDGIIFHFTEVSVTNLRNRWNQYTEIEIHYILITEYYIHIRHCLDMCELWHSKCAVKYLKFKFLFLFLEYFVICHNFKHINLTQCSRKYIQQLYKKYCNSNERYQAKILWSFSFKC